MCKANMHPGHWFIYGIKVVNNNTLIIIDEAKNDTSENDVEVHLHGFSLLL